MVVFVFTKVLLVVCYESFVDLTLLFGVEALVVSFGKRVTLFLVSLGIFNQVLGIGVFLLLLQSFVSRMLVGKRPKVSFL